MKTENINALRFAFYLSKFDENAYKSFGFKTKKETHEFIANKLNVKPSTLENMRDEFDSVHPNPRKGWYQKPLISSRVIMKAELDKYSESEIFDFLQHILNNQNTLFSNIEQKNISKEQQSAIEGEIVERKVLTYKRNNNNVQACKIRDNFTCQSCGFYYKKQIVECHHLQPLHTSSPREISVNELITLCPTCHKLAHTLLKENDSLINANKLISALKGAYHD